MSRNHERVSVVTEIILESSAGRRPSRISDLSMGGCYIESIANFRKGEEIHFEVETPDGPLRFSGNVAYVLDGLGFGMAFQNLGPKQLEFLKSVLPESATGEVKVSAENPLEI